MSTEKIGLQIKKVTETRAAKLKAMDLLVDTAAEETRGFKEEEKTQYESLKKEVEGMSELLTSLQEKEKRALGEANVIPASHETPGKDALGKTDQKNVRKANIGKFFRAAHPKFDGKFDGVEKELHDEAILEFKSMGSLPDFQPEAGTLIPEKALRYLVWSNEQRDIQATVANVGAELVNTDTLASNYIQALRPQNVLMNAGIEVLANNTGVNVNFPRENSLYTAAMAATENAAATESLTGTAFQTVGFAPKRGTGYVQVSNQALLQAPWFEMMLRKQIVKGNATLMDVQGINGSGSGGNARGILNTSGTGSVVGGTNGANFARTHIVLFEQLVGTAGGNLNNSKYITNFAVNRYGKQTETSVGSGRFLIDYAANIYRDYPATGKGGFGIIDQYPAVFSANVPATLTKGSSSGICSAIIFGDIDQAKFMTFGGLQIIVDPYVNGVNALTNYYVHQWFDFNVLLPGAFAVSVDMLTP